MLKVDKQPIINNRVRKINGSFSFIPHDFVTKGFLAALTHIMQLRFLQLHNMGRNRLLFYKLEN